MEPFVQRLYKVTLGDMNAPSCCSGVVRVYTKNINHFKREWMQLEQDDAVKERFNKSLNGEIVTDYYSDSPDLNIVQFDSNCVIHSEKEHILRKKEVELFNSYECARTVIINTMYIKRMYVEYNGQFLRLEKFKIKGIAQYNTHCFSEEDKDKKYTDIRCYGNPFLKHNRANDKFYYSNNLADFSDEIKSICYYCTDVFDSLEAMEEDMKLNTVDDTALQIMLEDIPGEAG